MSNLKSLYRRLVLLQPATGTKIDVPAERLLSTEIPVVEEERVSTADGTTRARGRTFRLPLRLAGEEEAQAARRMADAAGVQAILLGAPSTRQVVWAEDATLADVPEAAGPLTATAREVTLETTAFHADIGAGRDLFAGVPWEGTRPAPAVSLAPTGTDVSLSTSVTDGLTSIGDTASDLLGVSGGTTISEPIFGNTFASDSTNLNAARAIAFQESSLQVLVLDEESSTPHGIEVYDDDGSFVERGDYPGSGVPQSAAVASSLNLQRLFVADSGGIVEIINPNTYDSISSFAPQTSGDPAALAIRDHYPDAPPRAPLYLQTTEGVVEVYDWTEEPPEFIGVYDGGGLYDEVGDPADQFNALALHQGVLAGVRGTGDTLIRLLAFQLASEQDPPRAARSFRISETAEVGLDGSASGIQGDTPARLRMQAPIEGATVRLDAPSGDLLALDKTGTQIGSAFAGDSLSVPAGTFFLEVTIDSAGRRPALIVEDPGEATGVTAGTITGQEVESLFYFNTEDGTERGSGISSISAEDIASALNHSPGLSGGIRSKSEGIRSSGSETDTALVTEAAIRKALGTQDTGVSTLNNLDDTALTTDPYQSDRVLKGDGSGDYADVTVSAMLGEGSLEDLGGVGVSGLSDGQVLARTGTAWANEGISSLLQDHGALTDFAAVSSVTQSDGHVLASGGGAYREEDISSLTEGHVGLSDLSDVASVNQSDGQVVASDGTDISTEDLGDLLGDHSVLGDLGDVQTTNRDDGDVPAYDGNNTVYEHLSPNALIREHSDTGIFNEVLVGGVAVIRSDTEPTVAEWETELGRTLSNNEVPENVIWVDSSTPPSTTLAYDPEATSGFQQASYARSGYWIEYATGLLDAGLFTDGNIEAEDIIAEGSITGNEIKSETIITIGTNTQFILDGINDRFYSTDYSAESDGFEIDLKNSESQLPNLDVVGTLDADTWDITLTEIQDLSSATQTDGHVLASGGGDYRDEDIASLSADHTALGDHTDAGTVSKADGEVLIGGGSSVRSEALSAATEDHVKLADLSDIPSASTDGQVIADRGASYGLEGVAALTQDHVDLADLSNVATSGAENRQIARYDAQASEWTIDYIADLIRERGALSVGDVSFAATWRTIEQDSAPSTRDNGDPLQEGDVWIDTDASPVAEAYVWRNSQWNKTASAIGGNNIVTDSINTAKLTADAVTTNELQAGAARIGDVLIAGDNTTRSNTPPSNPKEYDIWIDTSQDPPDAKRWDGSTWVSSTFIGGELIQSDTISGGLIKANTITADVVDTAQLFADTGTITDFNASTAMIDEIRNNVFSGKDATIQNKLSVGSNPSIDIDGVEGRLESSNFVSGEAGFRFNTDGFAELENARIRGELRSTVVAQEEVLAAGGTTIHAPASQLVRSPQPANFINSVSENGDGFTINWEERSKQVLTKKDVADVGEKIRLKDSAAQGGELVGTVQAEYPRSEGILYELDVTVGSWPAETPVTRWDQRIMTITGTEFAPYHSYVESSSEFMRLGDIGGLAGHTGNGIVIGDDALVYDTDDQELFVSGRAEFPKGQIGPYTIGEGGLFADRLYMSRDEREIAFRESSVSETGLIQIPFFRNSSEWDEEAGGVVTVPTEYSFNTYEFYNQEDFLSGGTLRGDRHYSGAGQFIGMITTQIDVSSFQGKTITFEFSTFTGSGLVTGAAYDFDTDTWTYTEEERFGSIRLRVKDAGTGNVLGEIEKFNDGNATDNLSISLSNSQTKLNLTLRIEGAGGSTIVDEREEDIDNDGFGEVVEAATTPSNNNATLFELQRLKIFARSNLHEVGEFGQRLVDNSSQTSYELDRITGAVSQKSIGGSPSLPPSGAGQFFVRNGEPAFQDDVGNVYTLDKTSV